MGNIALRNLVLSKFPDFNFKNNYSRRMVVDNLFIVNNSRYDRVSKLMFSVLNVEKIE